MKNTVVGAVALAFATSVGAPVWAQQAQGNRPSFSDIQGFNIVLLVGELEGTSGPVDDLPQGARRALTDMKEFLPYKHYRVLDSQWTSCCGQSSRVNLSGRLQGVYAVQAGAGPNDVKLLPRPYPFALSVGLVPDGLQVQFSLHEEGGRTTSRRISPNMERSIEDARDELATLDVQIKEARNKVGVGVMPAIELRKLQDRRSSIQRQIQSLQAEAELVQVDRGANVRSVINSSFTMSVGETVVVGTSRIGGDKALIALVTAAKRSGSTAREE